MNKFYQSFTRYLCVLLVLATSSAWAQKSVSGTVTSSDDGGSLPGVSILEKGTTNGTATDVNGAFTLTVGNDATLVISFIGYKTVEVAVGDQTTVNVSLVSDVTALNEVVVIGYGEVNRKDATGAIATIKADDFNKGIISSPEQLIQGKTAGVQITTSSGEPGAATAIRIRGASSVRANNNPLYVVDGIPLADGDASAGGFDFGRGGGTAKNPLNFINPNDIESIDILKDASATAIYGSRGANGVVIVTTKSGKGKKKSLDYTANLTISRQAKYFDVLSGPEFLAAYGKYGDASLVNYGANTNWQKEISRTAISKSHNLSYKNSYKNGNYLASLSYDDQQGIIKHTSMNRMTGRFNVNHSFLNDKLKFASNIIVSKVKDEAAPITNSSGFEGDLLGSSIYYNPTIPNTPTNFDAKTGLPYTSDAANPLSLLKFYKDNTLTSRELLNFSLSYDITKELSVKVNTGVDRNHSERVGVISSEQTKMGGDAGYGTGALNEQRNNNNLFEAFMTYNKKIGKNSLNVVGGFSYQSFAYAGHYAKGQNFGSNINLVNMQYAMQHGDQAIRNAITTPWQVYMVERDNTMLVYDLFAKTPGAYTYGNPPPIGPVGMIGNRWAGKDELQSFYLRANYNIGEKYYFTGTYRKDGSTKFGNANKYGDFYAGSVKWRLSDEDFVPEMFDDLSLRVGYGVTGNQAIPHDLYTGRSQYSGASLQSNGALGNYPSTPDVTFPNRFLQWESTAQSNIGLDYGFFAGRLSGTIDAYRKDMTKMLMQVYAAQPSPQDFTWKNLDAHVYNTGVEFTLKGVVIDKKDYGFTAEFNMSYNKNIVKDFRGAIQTGGINGQGLTGAYAQLLATDQPLYSFYLREWTGFDADGINTGGDVQKFLKKSALPKMYGGLNLSGRYHGFDISAYMYGQFGMYVYSNNENSYFTKGALAAGHNVTRDVVSTNESVSNAPDVSTRFLHKADFVRMQNLAIGYNVKLPSGHFIKKLRISANGQNLFVITKYPGRDPEVNVDKSQNNIPSAGIDYTSYPRARSFTFGLNASF